MNVRLAMYIFTLFPRSPSFVSGVLSVGWDIWPQDPPSTGCGQRDHPREIAVSRETAAVRDGCRLSRGGACHVKGMNEAQTRMVASPAALPAIHRVGVQELVPKMHCPGVHFRCY